LSNNTELKIIANGDHKTIAFMIKNVDFLSDTSEVALIKRGHHDEIMAYIEKSLQFLSDDAKEALINRGNKEELAAAHLL